MSALRSLAGQRGVFAGLAIAALLVPTSALASDFSGLIYFFVAALLVALLMIVGVAYLVSRAISQRWLRSALIALAISGVLAPVSQSGIDYWGDPFSTTLPMLFFILYGTFMGDWLGAILPPLVFFLLVWGLIFLVSRVRAERRAARAED